MTTAALQSIREAYRQLQRARWLLDMAADRGEEMASVRSLQCVQAMREVKGIGEILKLDLENSPVSAGMTTEES